MYSINWVCTWLYIYTRCVCVVGVYVCVCVCVCRSALYILLYKVHAYPVLTNLGLNFISESYNFH